MITQIKKFGNSLIIELDPEVLKFKELKLGDWVDIRHIMRKIKHGGKNDTNNKKPVD